MTGASFDKALLALMSRHERVALTLAAQETAEGANPAATRLASAIHSTAPRRIAEMQNIRKTLR